MKQSRVSSLDKTNAKLPTITVAIVSHGADLIDEIFEEEDPNIRIFSRAGQPFCVAFDYQRDLNSVRELYLRDERTEDKNTKSSYQMLREVAKHFTNIKIDSHFKKLCDNKLSEYPTDSTIKHTKKTIECKNHNQIYTPSYDHNYSFNDNKGNSRNNDGIHVIETINHISKNNIDFESLPNLAFQNVFIGIPDIKVRKSLHERIIEEFLKKFKLGPELVDKLGPVDKAALDHLISRYPKYDKKDKTKPYYPQYDEKLDSETDIFLKDSKIRRYTNAILEKYPFTSPSNLIRLFSKEDSDIHELFSEEDDNILKSKAREMDILTINRMLDEKDKDRDKKIFTEIKAKKKKFLESKFYDYDTLIRNVKLSVIISFLKSEGFVVINIIDFSCRSVSGFFNELYLDSDKSMLPNEKHTRKVKQQEIINEHEENQLMGSESIDPNKGGRKKRRTKYTKSKKARRNIK